MYTDIIHMIWLLTLRQHFSSSSKSKEIDAPPRRIYILVTTQQQSGTFYRYSSLEIKKSKAETQMEKSHLDMGSVIKTYAESLESLETDPTPNKMVFLQPLNPLYTETPLVTASAAAHQQMLRPGSN